MNILDRYGIKEVADVTFYHIDNTKAYRSFRFFPKGQPLPYFSISSNNLVACKAFSLVIIIPSFLYFDFFFLVNLSGEGSGSGFV